MAYLADITRFLSATLDLRDFPDSSLNGLQVEGREQVQHVATAVDAGLAVIEEAVKNQADLLIVHHGLFWEKTFALVGPMKNLFQTLFHAELSLFAVHLPLDAHSEYGNNFVLARMLGLTNVAPFVRYQGRYIGAKGQNSSPQSLVQLRDRLMELPGADPRMLTLDFGPTCPQMVGIISGSGADALYPCVEEGIDTLVTGEPRQFAYHFAKENKLNVIFAGHYATETVGVQELGKVLAAKFPVSWSFINHPTGI